MAGGATDALEAALVSTVVSTVVSIIVSGISGRDAAKRAALAAKKEAVAKTIEEIVAAGRRYWRSEGIDSKLEQEINSFFDLLDFRLAAYFDHAQPGRREEMIVLRADGLFTLVTGDLYASQDRKADPTKVRFIKEAGDELHREFTDLQLTPRK